MFGSNITIADCAESDKHEPVGVKEGDSSRLLVVNALNVVEEAHPGSGREGGGGEGEGRGRRRRRGGECGGGGEGGKRRVVREAGGPKVARERERDGEKVGHVEEKVAHVFPALYSSPCEDEGGQK